MEGIFVYVLEYMLTLVSLDKMQNISFLICKSSKSEGRALKIIRQASHIVCIVLHIGCSGPVTGS